MSVTVTVTTPPTEARYVSQVTTPAERAFVAIPLNHA